MKGYLEDFIYLKLHECWNLYAITYMVQSFSLHFTCILRGYITLKNYVLPLITRACEL